MPTLLAIDPGDVYVGVAFFATDPEGEWSCVDAQEMSPDEFEEALLETVLDGGEDTPDTLVYERFRLYADKAEQQKGSEFRTSQCIGVIKFIGRIRNAHADKHAEAERTGAMLTCELQGGQCADPNKPVKHIKVVGQMADIKKPTRGILRHKKIKSVARPISKEHYSSRDHVIDAELHGWHWILNGNS